MESTQYICCKFIFLRNFINVFACKMVILFNNLSILLPETVLENCLETPGLKPFSTLCAKLRCSLFFQLEPSFFQLESLFKFRRLASPFDLYLFLFCLWNCSTCIYLWLSQISQKALNHIFFLLGECHALFPCVDCHTCSSISQWNCPT